jgi:peptidoglycan/xylan/chitin deacetylase (PgdA/CDA1 family)
MIDRLPFLVWPETGPCVTVLIYHRVMPRPDPLRPGEVDARQFDRQMQMLRRCFAPMTLADAVQALRRGTLRGRAVCVTFDDGYADNLTIAQPILARHGIPATVFVATGYLDGGRMFNDTIIDGVAAMHGDELDLRGIGLGVHRLRAVDDRRAAVSAILDALKRLPEAEREDRVLAVLRSGGVRTLPEPPMLTTPQLRQLSERGIEIGGHTVSHAILSSLSAEQATEEVDTGRRHLEQVLGRPIRQFAYPNGRPTRDYGPEHPALLERMGFDLAVSTAPGVLSAQQLTPYEIPRVPVWGRSITRIAARLARNLRSGNHSTACPVR